MYTSKPSTVSNTTVTTSTPTTSALIPYQISHDGLIWHPGSGDLAKDNTSEAIKWLRVMVGDQWLIAKGKVARGRAPKEIAGDYAIGNTGVMLEKVYPLLYGKRGTFTAQVDISGSDLIAKIQELRERGFSAFALRTGEVSMSLLRAQDIDKRLTDLGLLAKPSAKEVKRADLIGVLAQGKIERDWLWMDLYALSSEGRAKITLSEISKLSVSDWHPKMTGALGAHFGWSKKRSQFYVRRAVSEQDLGDALAGVFNVDVSVSIESDPSMTIHPNVSIEADKEVSAAAISADARTVSEREADSPDMKELFGMFLKLMSAMQK